jgi:hypothetical protein
VFHKINFDTYEYVGGKYVNPDSLKSLNAIKFDEIEGSFLRHVHNDHRLAIREQYYRSLFEAGDANISNTRLESGGLLVACITDRIKEHNAGGAYTLESAMERYVFLFDEVHKAFGHDSELLKQNLESLEFAFMQHVSLLIHVGKTSVEAVQCPEVQRTQDITVGMLFCPEQGMLRRFVDGINDGLSLEEAKQLGLEGARKVLEHAVKEWAKVGVHFALPSTPFYDLLNRSEDWAFSDIESLLREAELVSTFIMAMLQDKNDS